MNAPDLILHQIADSAAHSPLVAVIHVAKVGRWREMLDELVALMRRSGLYDALVNFHIATVGDEEAFATSDPKCEVIFQHPSLQDHEFGALDALHRMCRERRCRVMYAHLKGVVRDTPRSEDWRRYMNYFAIERFRDCVKALESHHVAGVNWRITPWPHFSGNVWWARSEYVRTLTPPRKFNPPDTKPGEKRYVCERWIGSGPAVRAACLHESGVDHYLDFYPREQYAADP